MVIGTDIYRFLMAYGRQSPGNETAQSLALGCQGEEAVNGARGA